MNSRLKIGCLIAILAAGMASAVMAAPVNPGRTNIGPGPPPPPPPPPPPRPPPPPQPTDYVVYFGFDQAVISPDAKEILAKAAKDVAAIVSLDDDYRTQLVAYYARMTMPGHSPQPLSMQEYQAYSPAALVVAYADTAGSATYNLRLSERRAKAAAAALVGLGVSPAAIATRWKGEADSAVNTGDNVQEPLNRRVTVHVTAGD